MSLSFVQFERLCLVHFHLNLVTFGHVTNVSIEVSSMFVLVRKENVVKWFGVGFQNDSVSVTDAQVILSNTVSYIKFKSSLHAFFVSHAFPVFLRHVGPPALTPVGNLSAQHNISHQSFVPVDFRGSVSITLPGATN